MAALGDDIGNNVDNVLTYPYSGVYQPNPSCPSALILFVNQLIKLAIPVGTFALILLLAIAGFKMITSQGNPEKINEAKEIVTNAFMGFAMIALSVVILLLINNLLNLNITSC
jgi:hypothetical protein